MIKGRLLASGTLAVDGASYDIGETAFIGFIDYSVSWSSCWGCGSGSPACYSRTKILVSVDGQTWNNIPSIGRYIIAQANDPYGTCSASFSAYEGLFAKSVSAALNHVTDPAQFEISGTVLDQYHAPMNGEQIDYQILDSTSAMVASGKIVSGVSGAYSELIAMNSFPSGTYTLNLKADDVTISRIVMVNSDGSVTWQETGGTGGLIIPWGLIIGGSILFFVLLSREDEDDKEKGET